jgi:serine/threonine protein kinase
MPNLIGQSLGRYHILEQLGEGGMAIVYKAYDTRLECDVAVKVIRTDNLTPNILDRALKRFEREAKALAKLTHPNIVKVIDFGEFEGKPYLVMPYLPGGTLKQKLTGQPIPWQEAMRLLLPITRSLDYAHRQGMIHRDVKPSNILITEDGAPMLTDFGIAKIIDDEVTVDLTGTSATVGTPEYMAPEQVVSKSVDHRADIYALGVVLYEMITGRKPFQADTPLAVLFKHASEPLPRPLTLVPDLPEEVEKVILKALAKKPEDRYADMAGFADGMESLLSGQRYLPRTDGRPQALSPRPDDSLQTLRQEATQDQYSTVPTPPARPRISSTPTTDPASIPPANKKPWWPWAAGIGGLLAVVLCILLLVGIPRLFGRVSPAATQAPLATEAPAAAAAPPATEVPAAAAAPPATEAPTAARMLAPVDTSSRRILFDTTHRNWGIMWGNDDRSLVSSFDYQIDMAPMPPYQIMDTYAFNLGAGEKTSFSLTTTGDYPFVAVWLDSGSDYSINVSLHIGDTSFSDQFWNRATSGYIHPGLFINSPGNWQGEIGPADQAGPGTLVVAGLREPPITYDLLRSYSMYWLHNPFNPFLPDEQAAIVDYLDMGGSVLIVDSNQSNPSFSFLLSGGPVMSEKLTNANIVQFYRHGAGRIAWMIPVSGNDNLYWDSGNGQLIISKSDVQKILQWLESGVW